MARGTTGKKEKAATGPSPKIPEVAAGDFKSAVASASGAKANLYMIAPDKLRVIPGFNPRIKEHPNYNRIMEELTASIRTEGFYATKPLAGYVGKDGEDDVIFVTDGHRRLEAVKAVNAEQPDDPLVAAVPVIVKPSGTSMVDLTVALVKENSGERLSVYENAIIVKRLLKHGLKEKEIAERLGFTPRWVADYLVLISSPPGVRNAVRDGSVAGTEAIRILREAKTPQDAEAKITAMVEKAREKGKTRATRKEDEDAQPKRAPKTPKTESEGGGEEVTSDRARGVPMETINMATVGLQAGDQFKLSEFRPWTLLFADWYELSEQSGYGIASYDVTFNASLRKPKETDAPAKKVKANDEAAIAEADGAETDDDFDELAEPQEQEEGELETAGL